MQDLPGVALIVRGGSVVLSIGAPAARYPVASVSKQFVAAAVLLLAERGLVALDDPVGRWFGPWGADITVHHLLTHTSGLGHWPSVGGIDAFRALDPAGRLAAVRDAAPVAAAGERWSYSGPGYLLLGTLVELVAGVPYGEFAGAELFTPLGLGATTSGAPPADPTLASIPGTGDVVSTAADLTRYTAALRAGELLSAESRQALTAPQADLGAEAYSLPAVAAHAYGYGVFVGTVAGRPATFHPGDNPGYQSLSVSIPSTDTSLAVLVHDDTTRLPAVLAGLAVHL